MAVVTLYRSSGWVYGARSLVVEIDGSPAEPLKPRGRLPIELPIGPHTIHVRIGHAASNVLQLKVTGEDPLFVAARVRSTHDLPAGASPLLLIRTDDIADQGMTALDTFPLMSNLSRTQSLFSLLGAALCAAGFVLSRFLELRLGIWISLAGTVLVVANLYVAYRHRPAPTTRRDGEP